MNIIVFWLHTYYHKILLTSGTTLSLVPCIKLTRAWGRTRLSTKFATTYAIMLYQYNLVFTIHMTEIGEVYGLCMP